MNAPPLFLLVATLGTAWQAWRGWILYARGGPFRVHLKPGPERWFGLYAADAFTHGALAAAGWVALWAAWERRCALAPGGELIGFASLAFFGLLGVTGQVPTILGRVRPPGG